MRETILVLGVSHHTATLATRERLTLSADEARNMLRRLAGDERIHEAVVVSTCNRAELYAVAATPQDGEAALQAAFQRHGGIGAAAMACASYTLTQDAAVEHLFRVAAGLDSAIVGESEIVAQLRGAVALSEQVGTLGPLLRGTFDRALLAGRHVRRRTSIGRGSTSLAALVAKAALAHQQDRGVLLIGAGALVRSLAAALTGSGAQRLMIANRTESAARRLADVLGAEVVPLSALDRALPRADVIVTATGAPRPILTVDRLEAVARARRPRAVFDLAVPRDVEPAVATLPGVVVHDLERLHAWIERNRAARSADVEHAGELVRDEVARFAVWRRDLAVAPTVRGVWRRAERMRQEEIARSGALDAEELERLDLVTAALVRKLLEGPMRRLRAASATGAPNVEALCELFDAHDDMLARGLRLVECGERGAA